MLRKIIRERRVKFRAILLQAIYKLPLPLTRNIR